MKFGRVGEGAEGSKQRANLDNHGKHTYTLELTHARYMGSVDRACGNVAVASMQMIDLIKL